MRPEPPVADARERSYPERVLPPRREAAGKRLSARALAAIGVVAMLAMSAASLSAADFSQFRSRMQAKFAAELPSLSLSAEKRAAVEAIIGTSLARRVAILQRHGVNPEGRNPPGALQPVLPEIQAANTDLRADLAKVLSEDELKTYDAISDKLRRELIAALGGG